MLTEEEKLYLSQQIQKNNSVVRLIKNLQQRRKQPGVVVHTFNLCAWEAEANESQWV